MNTLSQEELKQEEMMFQDMYLIVLQEDKKEYRRLLKENKLESLVKMKASMMIEDLQTLMRQGLQLNEAREIVRANHLMEE